MALAKPNITSNSVKQAHEQLNKLAYIVRMVRITWIKTHHGHDGNELADEYAKLGTLDHRTTEAP